MDGNIRYLNIKEGDMTVFWGLDNAVDNENITIAAARGDEENDWILERLI